MSLLHAIVLRFKNIDETSVHSSRMRTTRRPLTVVLLGGGGLPCYAGVTKLVNMFAKITRMHSSRVVWSGGGAPTPPPPPIVNRMTDARGNITSRLCYAMPVGKYFYISVFRQPRERGKVPEEIGEGDEGA